MKLATVMQATAINYAMRSLPAVEPVTAGTRIVFPRPQPYGCASAIVHTGADAVGVGRVNVDGSGVSGPPVPALQQSLRLELGRYYQDRVVARGFRP